jgi:hypothetical protein
VIACRQRLFHPGLTLGEQAGQQYRGFHLRAGHRRPVFDGAQLPAANAQRCMSVLRFNLRSHHPQGLHHAPHRTPRQRLVAHQLGGEFLSGEDAGQHAHGRS